MYHPSVLVLLQRVCMCVYFLKCFILLRFFLLFIFIFLLLHFFCAPEVMDNNERCKSTELLAAASYNDGSYNS